LPNFADLFTWTCSHDYARREDFLSLCLARLAERDVDFAKALIELCGLSPGRARQVRVLAQRIVATDEGRGVRTDVELLWNHLGSRRLVIECKVADSSDAVFTEELGAQIETYRHTLPQPDKVVALVVRPVHLDGAAVITWWHVRQILRGSERPEWREAADLLDRAGVVLPTTLPNIEPAEVRDSRRQIEAADKSVRTALLGLVPEAVRGTLLGRLDKASWPEDDIGWTWWSDGPLPGTKVKGLSLYALAEGPGLHWWLDVLPSNKVAARLLSETGHLFSTASDGWWSADLGTAMAATLGGQLVEVTRAAVQVLLAVPEIHGGAVETLRVSQATSRTHTEDLARAVLAIDDLQACLRALKVEAVAHAHRQLEDAKPNPIWGARSGRSRFYLFKGRLQLGVGWGEDKLGTEEAITLWIWPKNRKVREWVIDTLGPALQPGGDGDSSLHYPLGNPEGLKLGELVAKVDEYAARLLMARGRMPRG